MKISLETLSLKLRLNLLITALLVLIMAIGAMQLVNNARENVRAEIESTSALVSHLLDAEIAYLNATGGFQWQRRPFQLQGLQHIRHFKIEHYDAFGLLRDSNYGPASASATADVPDWFIQLMDRINLELAAEKRVVPVNNGVFGQLVITPDPSYEIAEIWDDAIGLLALVALFFLAVNVMVYWAVDRALRPVNNIWHALNELETGNLEARLPSFDLPELTRISEKFNHMAQTLQHSINRNHRLSQQLIQLQEEERKNLARDLHDELGQYLTAIMVDGSALLAQAKARYPQIRESAQAIVDVTQQVMQLIRAMLQRLRPEVLDGLGLRAAIQEMLAGWRERNAGVSCIIRIADDIDGAGDEVNITAYRIVQECLTNVARHAAPTRVEITMHWQEDRKLEIIVTDNGKGFDMNRIEGFGLNGMRERVEGMGGRFSLLSRPGQGTTVRAVLPQKGEAG